MPIPTLRDQIAIAVMRTTQQAAFEFNDFMIKAGVSMPRCKQIPGALGDLNGNAIARGQFSADEMKLKCDMVNEWGIGAYRPEMDCSTIYDPGSPWYNTFYGSYALLSHKPNGSAWGYSE